MRKIAFVLSLILGLSSLCACSEKKETAPSTEPRQEEQIKETEAPAVETENTIEAEMTLTNGKVIEFELYPDVAPKTVANFVKNVQEGFYSGTIFHRVIEGFMIQGGGYDEALNHKSVSETVEGEFSANGIENNLKHTRGVLSMARTDAPNSASTQFFIMHEDAPHLDGQYAAFGKVTEGMDVVDEIAQAPIRSDAPNGLSDLPEEMFVIQEIIIKN